MSLILSVIVGALAGTLINYFSDVLPASRRLTRPQCSECAHPYSAKEYLIAHKCSDCGHKASNRTISVLVGAILICILLQYFPFFTLSFWATLPVLVFLGVILIIDIEHRVVLFETSIFGLILFLIYGSLLHGLSKSLLGGLGGLLIMLIFYYLGIVFTKIAGKLRHQEISEVAFGFGDVCAGTVFGLLTGWPSIAGVVILALLAFGAYSLVLIFVLLVSKRYRAFSSALPFAPFLVLGVIVIFYI